MMNLQITISPQESLSIITINEPGNPEILAQWTHPTREIPIWVGAITTAYLRYMKDQGATAQQIGMVVQGVMALAGGIMAEINSETAFWLKQFGGMH